MSRTIRSLWITRKSIDCGFHPAELLIAWDEWTVDENPEGWANACKEALEAVGDDLAAHRYIDLLLHDKGIDDAFEPASTEVRSTKVRDE